MPVPTAPPPTTSARTWLRIAVLPRAASFSAGRAHAQGCRPDARAPDRDVAGAGPALAHSGALPYSGRNH